MARWYYVDGRQAAGPVDDDELRLLAQSGRLGTTSLVTPVGATEWATLADHEDRLGLRRHPDGGYRPDPPDPPGAAEPRPAAAAGLRAAPLRRRAAAALVDGVLFGLPALTLTLLTDGVAVADQAGRASVRFGALGLGLAGVLAVGYFGVLVGVTGQTPGKLALAVRVVDERSGAALGPIRGAGRVVAWLAMGTLCGLPLLVDLLWPLGDHRRRALHDRLVGGWVIDSG